MDVCIETGFSHYFFLLRLLVPHFHLRSANALRVGLPFGFFIGPLTPDIRAQKDLLRAPPPGWGAFKFEPVALLYFLRPAAVSPPERDLCLPILRLTFFATLHTFLRGTTFLCTVCSFALWHYQTPGIS